MDSQSSSVPYIILIRVKQICIVSFCQFSLWPMCLSSAYLCALFTSTFVARKIKLVLSAQNVRLPFCRLTQLKAALRRVAEWESPASRVHPFLALLRTLSLFAPKWMHNLINFLWEEKLTYHLSSSFLVLWYLVRSQCKWNYIEKQRISINSEIFFLTLLQPSYFAILYTLLKIFQKYFSLIHISLCMLSVSKGKEICVHSLIIKDGSKWYKEKLKKAQRETRFVRNIFGRIWVLSFVSCTDSANAVQIKETEPNLFKTFWIVNIVDLLITHFLKYYLWRA